MVQNGQPERISQRLKRLRLAAGLSQRDLSSPGVSYAYISRIEAGARTPSVKALRKLAEKLGVTVEYLETGKDETLVDELLDELMVRTRAPVRVTVALGYEDRVLTRIAHVRFKSDGTDLSERASNMTEALLGALARIRERDNLGQEQERIAARMRAVVRA